MEALQNIPFKSLCHLIVVAGAGMSADSGLPTFSDPFAVWGAEEGSPTREALKSGGSPLRLFRERPAVAWPMYLHRLESCLTARIHDGYGSLMEFSRLIPGKCAVLTSNVDGLFARAGFPLVHECHGQITRLQCHLPCNQNTWEANAAAIRRNLSCGVFPVCGSCGEAARPNMSWGDGAFVHTEADERARTFTAAVKTMQGAPTFVIECGVSPKSGLRRFSENLLREREDVFLLRINPDAESVSGNCLLTIADGAEITLVRLLDTMRAALC